MLFCGHVQGLTRSTSCMEMMPNCVVTHAETSAKPTALYAYLRRKEKDHGSPRKTNRTI